MTHDELLAEIDYLQVEGTWDISADSPRFDLVAKNYRALRAVVELHKPRELAEIDPDLVPKLRDTLACPECIKHYPCPTIQAIEGEVK